MGIKELWKKTWNSDKVRFVRLKTRKVFNFIWHEDSWGSWIVNIILAFVIVKFIIFPGLAFALGTTHPVVAVVSCSMEHNKIGDGCSFDHLNFDNWWEGQAEIYGKIGITKKDFNQYGFSNGFNKGDLMVLRKIKEINKGDVVVFWGAEGQPIIHRAVITEGSITTKGDNNLGSRNDEFNIANGRLIGKAWFRIPYFGWMKVWFTDLILFFK